MAFIANNPIVSPKMTEKPTYPPTGTRGIYPQYDGWYDIDENGNIKSLSSDELKSIVYYNDVSIKPSDNSLFKFTLINNGTGYSISANRDYDTTETITETYEGIEQNTDNGGNNVIGGDING